MTKQQIKDYEKFQSTEILKLWLEQGDYCFNYDGKYKTIEDLPISCGLSDADCFLDNQGYLDNDDVDYAGTKRINAAKAFIRRYKI